MHKIVLEKLGKDKVGLVMDRTQAGQVWNQPVFAATTEVGPLVDIASLSSSRMRRLAPGTVAVAEVRLGLDWLAEPGAPQMSYQANFERQYTNRSFYRYLLEVDSDGVVIGGEWGSLTDPRPEGQIIPDFIYGFEKDSAPVSELDSGFDYEGIVAKIHECSMRPETTGVFENGGRQVPVVNCEL
jgi:hypothetical protein